MKKLFLSISIIVFLMPTLVLADGGIIFIDPYSGGVDVVPEKSQNALIGYENGKQKMLLEVKFQPSNKKAVWLLPVPAAPEQIDIDIMTTYPEISGVDVNNEASDTMRRIRGFLLNFQVFTFFSRGVSQSLGMVTGSALDSGEEEELVIHKRIEKKDLIGELITAKNSQAIYNYFNKQGLKITPGLISQLDYYLGKDYSFVATWISPSYESNEALTRVLYSEFATQKIYYPLVLTSIYKDVSIPTNIKVFGLVKPEIPQDIKKYSQTTYYTNTKIDSDTYKKLDQDEKQLFNKLLSPHTLGGNNFINKASGDYLPYTKVSLNAPSYLFNSDLWFSFGAPFKIRVAYAVDNKLTILSYVFLFVISLLSGLIAAWMSLAGYNRKNWWKYSLIGLGNMISLLGLVFVVYMPVKKFKNKISNLFFEPDESAGTGKRKPKLTTAIGVILFIGLFIFNSFMLLFEGIKIKSLTSGFHLNIKEMAPYFSRPELFYDGLSALSIAFTLCLIAVLINNLQWFSQKAKYIFTYLAVYSFLVYSITKVVQIYFYNLS